MFHLPPPALTFNVSDSTCRPKEGTLYYTFVSMNSVGLGDLLRDVPMGDPIGKSCGSTDLSPSPISRKARRVRVVWTNRIVVLWMVSVK